MAFRFRACSRCISSIPILHCTKSRDRVRLQSSDQRWFGPGTKAPLRRQADRRAEWSNARHDADRPDARNGIEQEFGVAHSSSQRSSDTIGNTPPPSCQSLLMTPAGPPPPAGVIVFAGHLANHTHNANPSSPRRCSCRIQHRRCRTHAAHAWVPFQSRAFAHRSGRLYPSHRSGGGLLLPTSPTRIGSPSSSQAANRYQQRPPDLLPRRALLFALQPTNPAWLVYLCDAEPGFWPEFRLNFRLTCVKRIGAIRQLRCPFSQRSVYFNLSDQGGAKDERPPSTQAHERGK